MGFEAIAAPFIGDLFGAGAADAAAGFAVDAAAGAAAAGIGDAGLSLAGSAFTGLGAAETAGGLGLSLSQIAAGAQIGTGLMGIGQGQQMIDASKSADPFGPYRPQFAQQLMALMKNPQAVTELPGYKQSMAAGEQTLTRNLASQGLTGSGAAAEALVKFGGEFQNTSYQQTLANLSHLSGADINGAGTQLQGLAAGTNTQNQSMNNLIKVLPALMGG